MSPSSLLLSIHLLIELSTACTYYAQRHPEPPFNEVARFPLGICTGTHYAHNTIPQQSIMYLCSADNSHIIQYSYTDSSQCEGQYSASIATRDQNDFNCDDSQTCPYIVIKVHNDNYDANDWRKWYSLTWITNTCQNGELYSCEDNTEYQLNKFLNDNCDDLPTEIVTYSAENSLENMDIFCNEPDPMTAVLNFPDTSMFLETDGIGWNGDGTVTNEIISAVCLDGRLEGGHKEIGNTFVSYCFIGYDQQYSKPIYRGEVGEIKWTESAGDGYGGAFGLFLYTPTDVLGLKYPIAYCFSGESKDISVCDQRWYVDHGTSTRYFMDENMRTAECECTVDLMNGNFEFDVPVQTMSGDGEEVMSDGNNITDSENGVLGGVESVTVILGIGIVGSVLGM